LTGAKIFSLAEPAHDRFVKTGELAIKQGKQYIPYGKTINSQDCSGMREKNPD
jgi:hypothetical protein